MPRGYRCIVVAALGWLALTGLNQAAPDSPKNTQDAVEGQRGANTRKAAQTVAAAVRDTIHIPEKDSGCNDRQDRRDSDLCAQWKAADAARDAANYAFWTLLVSTIGTGLLIWTLWDTRQTSRRELRAYITVEKVRKVGVGRDYFHAYVDYVNRGATPAHIVDFSYRVWVAEPSLAHPSATGPDPAPQVLAKKVVGKDEPDSVLIGINKKYDGVEAVRGLLNKSTRIYVYGWIVYLDVFKRKHRTFFSYVAQGPITIAMNELVPTHRGNSAT